MYLAASWGAYIKDVRTGRGVSPKADIVREVAWIYSYRSSQNVDKGGRGSKIPKILRTSVWSLTVNTSLPALQSVRLSRLIHIIEIS